MKPSKQFRFAFLTVLALGVGAAPARASWGSLRANNHEGHHAEPAHVERRPEPAHVERRVVHEEPARVVERRRLDIEPERRHAFYWSRFHPGMFLHALPVGYVPLVIRGASYDYYDGVYFQPAPDGQLAVVAPPIGATVPTLPEGVEPVVIGATTYYYAGGAFYLQQPAGFVVVPAPIGVTISDLPDGAGAVSINGATYFQAGGNYFQPIMQGGVTVYLTARP